VDWKRVAIIGTAQTWIETPWDDKGLSLMGVNDAYNLGWKRAPDAWFDQHPFHLMRFHDKRQPLDPKDIKPGTYLRPAGHLEWLKKTAENAPVYLHDNAPAGWPPQAMRYPVEEISAKYRKVLRIDETWPKDYVASGPAWMLLMALEQRTSRIEIYGIHLATDGERQEQRFNFELLIGYAIGLGVDIKLPKTTPLCKSKHVYCYEPRLSTFKEPLKRALVEIDTKRAETLETLVSVPWWRPRGVLQRRLEDLEARRLETVQEIRRMQLQEELSGPEWRTA